MGWIDGAPVSWVAREAAHEKPEEEWTSQDLVSTTMFVERSVDLQQVDPGSRLRIEIGEAVDRHPLGERLDLVSFGNGAIEIRELPIPARVGSAVASASAELPEHTHVDLHEAFGAHASWMEGPECVVLLCSPHIEVDPRLLYAAPDLDAQYADPSWPVAAPTDPTLTTKEPTVYDEHGFLLDYDGDAKRPGGRHDACIVIASIGGEPSPKLRHLAELSGGIALPVRNAEEADAFAVACRQRFQAVVAAVDAREAAAERYSAEARVGESSQMVAGEVLNGEAAAVEPEVEHLAEQAATFLAIEDAVAKWQDVEHSPDEFIHVDVLVERSVAAIAADPAGAARRAIVDGLHERSIGRSRSLSTYGWGLISTRRLLYVDDFRGPIRDALREPNDHSRVDLARACRQIQRLSGPKILIVLATSLIDPFDLATTGIEYEDGPGLDDSTREPVGDGQHYEKELEGRYPTVVLLGGLDGAVRPELAAWAESTGGFAMPVRSGEEIAMFAQRCSDVYDEWVEQIDAECTSGVLDLDQLFG